MPELIRIYWRDIPSQVMAKAGRRAAKVMLDERFQHAIDRAAMRAGKGGSDAYMEDWRREREPCGAELESIAADAAAALEAEWDAERLERTVKAKGVEPAAAEAAADRAADPATASAAEAAIPAGSAATQGR